MTDDAAQAEVERANRRHLWVDVANLLTRARVAIEAAQTALDDLGESAYGDQLQTFVDDLNRAANDARTEAAAT